ncbi:MAG: hypothetical protein V4525_08440 [Pseudomonadota bacterium]
MQYRVTLVSIALFVHQLTFGATVANDTDFGNMKPTPEMIQESKRNPNGWVYVIEGNYGPNDTVPPEAIAGSWKVDAKGNIVLGSFQANPKYKPKQSKW